MTYRPPGKNAQTEAELRALPVLDFDAALEELARMPPMPPEWPVLFFWAQAGRLALEDGHG